MLSISLVAYIYKKEITAKLPSFCSLSECDRSITNTLLLVQHMLPMLDNVAHMEWKTNGQSIHLYFCSCHICRCMRVYSSQSSIVHIASVRTKVYVYTIFSFKKIPPHAQICIQSSHKQDSSGCAFLSSMNSVEC